MKTFTYLGVTMVLPSSVPAIFQEEQRLANTKKFLAGGMWTFEQVKDWEVKIRNAEK